jgi:diacylglycerol O-acyltransferase
MEPLTAVDTAWFRMEEAKNPVDIVSVLVFAGALDHERFRQTVTRRLLRSRRFRQRVERRPLGRPRWVDDQAFSLDDHVHFHRLPRGAGREALEGAISTITSEQMDLRRPLWDLHVFDGYEGERSVLVARLHHAMGDGFALMSLLLAMADEAPEWTHEEARRHQGDTRRPGRDVPRPLPRDAWGEAERWARHVTRSAQSLAQLVLLPFDPENDLRGQLSGRRLCTWSKAIPLTRIKEIGRSMNATVNDVVLTALAGGLRRYLTASGEEVDALAIRALVPVNLRAPGEPVDWDRLGNCFGLVYLDLPVHLASPEKRLFALQQSMKRLKRSPQAGISRGLLYALGFIPTRLSHVIDGVFAKKGSIVATNVPGPKQPLSFAGQRVEEAVFFVPHPGRLAVGASIFSYAGSLRVGIRTDAAVVDDPHALVRAFEDELEALPGGATQRKAQGDGPTILRSR